MTPSEANKIIAEHMGTKEIAIYYLDEDKWCGGNSLEYTKQKCENYQRQGLNCELRERVIVTEAYTESLDALVPVWEKVGIAIKLNGSHVHINDPRFFINEEGDDMFEAAAIATAKAIRELK